MLTAFEWALLASLLTGDPVTVAAVAIVGLLVVLIGNGLDHD